MNLIKNKEIILEKLKSKTLDINDIDYNIFIKDVELLKTILDYNPFSFRYMPEEIRGNKKIALEVLKECPYSFQWVSDRLKDDKEIVLCVVKQCGCYIGSASERLKRDKDIVKEAVKREERVLNPYYFSEETPHSFNDDEEIVLEAVKGNNLAFNYATDRLKNNKRFIIKLAKGNFSFLEWYCRKVGITDRDFYNEMVISAMNCG